MLGLAIIPIFWILSGAQTVEYTDPLYNLVCSDIFQASETELAEVTVLFYTGPTVNDYVSFPVGDSTSIYRALNKSNGTKMYIFGWKGFPELSFTQEIIGAYLERGGYNVLLGNWTSIASGTYPYAACSIKNIAYRLCNLLNELVALGLSPSTIHMIGHSLGAQMCGYIARGVNFRMSHVTGLDPAGPGFNFIAEHLSSADADFVDIIHTDEGVYGTGQQAGHVDFYPNGGVRFQPGCSAGLDTCSHYRSCDFEAESVRFENSFIGCLCDSYSNFLAGLCDSNPTAVMGDGTPTNATRGKYYLKTNSASPYGQGINGASNQPPTSLLGSILGTIL